MLRNLRSDIGYGVLSCFLTDVDEEQGVDDIIYDIRIDECNCMPYTELSAEIPPVNLALLIEDLIESISLEVTNNIKGTIYGAEVNSGSNKK